MRRSAVLSLPAQLVFLGQGILGLPLLNEFTLLCLAVKFKAILTPHSAQKADWGSWVI
jgi:hypothetical protein